MTVLGYTKTFTSSPYGEYSTPASIASLMAARLSMDTSSPVWAKASGATITFAARVPGSLIGTPSGTTPTHSFTSASFTFSGSSGTALTPSLEVHCTPGTIEAWTSGPAPGLGQTTDCVASITGVSAIDGAYAPLNPVVFTVNTAAWASPAVGADGDATALGLSETSGGTYTIAASYSATTPYTDSHYPAMSATTTVVVNSTAPCTTCAAYSYSITNGTGGSGYDGVGNIVGYADSVNGQWSLSYDALNRLVTGVASPAVVSGMPYYCWSYDSFGNRLRQNYSAVSFTSSMGSCSGGGSSPAIDAQSYNSSNQLTGATLPSGSFGYDPAGDITSDPANNYAYDAEGQPCAMSTWSTVLDTYIYEGYLYDAEGRRVAKGSLSSLSCDISSNGFTVTASYILGPDGQTMTELDGSGNWKHTDVSAGGGLVATYDPTGLHFQFSDWLGTRRVQTDYTGSIEDTYQSLPFGELIGSSGSATEKHFTGKEHDSESGNDYFDARYYASSAGRFMIPDWSAIVEPVPYARLGDPQSLNLYGYVGNNPLSKVDLDGHSSDWWQKVLNFTSGNGFITDAQQASQVSDPREIQRIAAGAQQTGQRQSDGSYKAPTGPGSDIYNRLHGGQNDSIGSHECVAACSRFSGVTQHTDSWVRGRHAYELTDADIGTAIATFDKSGHYPTGEDKNSGIFMGHDKYGRMLVVEQWPAGHGRTEPVPPFERPIPNYGPNNTQHANSDNANAYYVIRVP